MNFATRHYHHRRDGVAAATRYLAQKSYERSMEIPRWAWTLFGAVMLGLALLSRGVKP